MNYRKHVAWGFSLIWFFGILAAQARQVDGQASQYEFVQSSSPLGDGRTVTRTLFSDPNKRNQLVISSPSRVANLPRSNSLPGFPPNRSSRPSGFGQGNAANSAPTLSAPPNQINPAEFDLPPHLPNNSGSIPGNSPGNALLNGQMYPYPASGTGSTTYGRFVSGAGPRPLLKLRTLPANTYVGQGMLGQPTAYVPGEPVRNFIRYIMP